MTVMGIIQAYANRIVQLVILSAIVITVLGGIKATGIYNRFKNKDVRKLLLFLSCIVLDLVAVVIYIVQENVGWDNYLPAAIGTVGITTVMYAFYENVYVRKLIQLIFRSVKNGILKVILKQQTPEEARQIVVDTASEALKEAVTGAAMAIQNAEKQPEKVVEETSKLVVNVKETAADDFEKLLSAVKKANGN